jgi:ribosomal protein S18 acetylase RimI-like enzyme
VIIRKATIADYNQLMNLYNLFVGDDRFSNKDADSFKEALANNNNFLYIAADSNKLVGFMAFSIKTVVRYSQPITTLDEMYVLGQYRRKGIGKQFMDVLETKSKDLNCRGIFLESGKDLKTAHQFYKKLGYIKRGYYFTKDL